MKDIKFLLYNFWMVMVFIIPGIANASGIDTLKSPADFYIASTQGEASFDDAEPYFIEAVESYRGKDCEALFLSHVYLVDYYRYRNLTSKCMNHIDTVKSLLSECDIRNHFILSEYNKNLGSAFALVGDNEKAIECYSKAVYLLTPNKDTLPEAAMALFKKALFLKNKFKYDSAEVYYKAAWRQIQILYEQPNVYYLIILNGLADIYQGTVQLDKAIKTNELLIHISEEYDIMREWYLIGSNINLGSIYYHRNELEKAELAYRHALNKLDDRYAVYRSYKASVLYNIGLVFHAKGEYQNALAYYKDALKYTSDMGENTKGAAYLNMADVYFHMDSVDLAADYYKISIDTIIHFFGDHSINAAKAMLAAADFHARTGIATNVFPWLYKAYKIYQEQDSDHPKAAWCRIKLGDFYASRQIDSAFYYYNEGINEYPALDLLLKANHRQPFGNPEVNIELINLLQRKSLLFLYMAGNTVNENDKRNLLINGLATIDTAIHLFGEYRNSLSLESSRLFINNNYSNLTEIAVMLCRQLIRYSNDQELEEQLYSYIERYKAAVLSSEIAEASVMNNPGVNDSLFILDKRYRQDITSLKNYLHRKQSSAEDQPLTSIAREQLIDLYIKQEKIHEEIARKYPAFMAAKNPQNSVDINEVQRVLNEDECIVDYFCTDTCLVSCYISNDEINIRFQTIHEDFGRIIEQLSLQTRDSDRISFNKQELLSYVNDLSSTCNVLLDTGFIRNKRQIIVIPDAYLSTLPFGILITKPIEEITELAALPYLNRSYNISYDYSAALYVRNMNSENKMLPRVAGFAPVYNYPTEEDLPALTASPQEIVDIARYFDVKSYFRYQATKDKFKMEQGDYSILHLAMHTSIDSADPSYSKLIFAPDTTKDDDHVLNVSEIYNMEISAGLAVLSGCNSGYGKLSLGEGLLSLARAFYMAGSKSIVMNLWQVEDKVSEQIFDRFYFHLSNGKSRGEALRMAKMDFLESADPRFHHPHYWGGFVLIGQKSHFLSNFGSRQVILLTGACLSIFLAIVFVRREIQKR